MSVTDYLLDKTWIMFCGVLTEQAIVLVFKSVAINSGPEITWNSFDGRCIKLSKLFHLIDYGEASRLQINYNISRYFNRLHSLPWAFAKNTRGLFQNYCQDHIIDQRTACAKINCFFDKVDLLCIPIKTLIPKKNNIKPSKIIIKTL